MKSETTYNFEPGMIETEVRLTKELTEEFRKMTKKTIIERFIVLALELKVAQQTLKVTEDRLKTAVEEADKAQASYRDMKARADQSEEHVEQAEAMIQAIMERWHHYTN